MGLFYLYIHLENINLEKYKLRLNNVGDAEDGLPSSWRLYNIQRALVSSWRCAHSSQIELNPPWTEVNTGDIGLYFYDPNLQPVNHDFSRAHLKKAQIIIIISSSPVVFVAAEAVTGLYASQWVLLQFNGQRRWWQWHRIMGWVARMTRMVIWS